MGVAPQVLVVDDDVVLAEITCELMESVGASAIYRTSILDATDALARHAASLRLLITDVNLGSPMSGIELAVYAAQEWPRVAICVVSGVYHERPRPLPETALFLVKPCRTEELIVFAQRACDVPIP